LQSPAKAAIFRIMQFSSDKSRVIAVLGPTNTGKTHLAMERMLGFESGMIGFPLRLLARENYERAIRIRGKNQVALMTGEEKILPAGARYFLCTVESMPVDRQVAFLGVDEIQMCADPDRGHIFTDRLLHARGGSETMFMGAETIKPLIRKLVPETIFETRNRFSTLTWTGGHKITRLPARSAIVAFSAAEVYAIAEMVRRHRGGAAVVLGALSPRTRNAQVAMYQAGEVDYLVATDAIGMGLNMDVDHVAFAQTRKFDGRVPRNLIPAEMAQIAGRAGRHMNNGTFGTTADSNPIDPDVAAQIENHSFDDLKFLYWRNARLRRTSLGALKSSLTKSPDHPGLVRARSADDELALDNLAKDPQVSALATTPEAVSLLWEVCQIPDFGKVMSDAHTRLLARLFTHLRTGPGRLPTDWVAANLARIDRTDGDIETLAQRIANVRTWTYVSFRSNWLEDAGHWQERARAVEDRLSDALHERLTQRFVDKRTATLVRRMKDNDDLIAAVTKKGDVVVEGHFVGHLKGFRFTTDDGDRDPNARRAATNAALKALRSEIGRRVTLFEAETDDAFSIGPGGSVLWQGETVARLAKGPDILAPVIDPLSSDLLDAQNRERVRRRLDRWLLNYLHRRMGPLLKLHDADLPAPARGLAFQLAEWLGSAPRRLLEPQIKALGPEGRRAVRRLGVRIGRHCVYLQNLGKSAAVEARVLLWTIFAECTEPPAQIPTGRVSVPVADGVADEFYLAAGYVPTGKLAVRVDILERLAERAWILAAKGPFAIEADILNLAGCGNEDIDEVMAAIDFQQNTKGSEVTFSPAKKRRRRSQVRNGPPKDRRPRPDSPFAGLQDLVNSR
jgi:ATP-dependent RNA helicase SUPV3L1/SUV3